MLSLFFVFLFFFIHTQLFVYLLYTLSSFYFIRKVKHLVAKLCFFLKLGKGAAEEKNFEEVNKYESERMDINVTQDVQDEKEKKINVQ